MNEGLIFLAPDGTLEFATPGTYELFCCTTLDDLRTRWSEIGARVPIPPEHAPTNGAAATQIDLEFSTGDKAHRLRVEVYPVAQEATGYAAVVHDRELLEALDTDFRLATQLRALSGLYGSIAHDLRAPIAAVLLHLELLRGTLDDDREGETPRDRRLRYVGIMKNELERLNRSLTSLFTHIALRAETSEPFDLRELLQEIEFLIRPRAQRQSVALELSPGDRPARMRGDRDAMKQAILNVAVNALEAMPDGGRLQITLETKDEAVTISIRDTGPGIPDGTLPHIFDLRFTTKPSGCGMGLYVTRSVLERCGGSVRTDPSREGMCFHLDVPTAEEV